MKHKAFLFLQSCLILSLLFGMHSCKTTKVNAQGAKGDVILSLERTPCFGRCPVYVIKIYEDGLLLYQGKRNVADTGCHYRKISKQELASLKQAFSNVGFFEMADSYPESERAPVDLPSCIIFFKSGNQEKTITDHHWKTPEKLALLERKIDSLTTSKFSQFCDN